MKTHPALGLFCLLASGAMAQRGGGIVGRGYYRWFGFSSGPGYWNGNSSYSYPVVQDYSPSPDVTVIYAAQAPAAAPSQSLIYLIAFKDHEIRAAETCFVNGGTLHFVTLERQQKEANLDSVDLALSERLNRERAVDRDRGGISRGRFPKCRLRSVFYLN